LLRTSLAGASIAGITPVAEASAAVIERFDYVDRQLMLTLGGLYGR
jgi:hypothetical protein